MQVYKLSAASAALGLSPLQIIKSGRIVAVIWAVTLTGTTGQGIYPALGIAAVDEFNTKTSSPVSCSGIAAEIQTTKLIENINVQHNVDYPVEAGQSLVINNLNASGTYQIECWVYVK